jgi:hypothetical protein
MGTGGVVTGTGGVLLTTLMGSTLLTESPTNIDQLALPVVPVNVDHSLLSEWLSESIESHSDEPFENECLFYNFSKGYTSEYCDAFTLSRIQSGTIQAAKSRALKCAAKASTECILSHEVGLSVPVAFLARQDERDGMKAIIAPRNVSFAKDDPKPTRQHVRVHVPGDAFGSRRLTFNDTTRVEYLSESRSVETHLFIGSDAFCLALLRASYEHECWKKLDGV